MSTRKCPRCEAQVELESKVCHACGLVFSSSETVSTAPNAAPAASSVPPPPEKLTSTSTKRREKMSPNKTYATSNSGRGGFGVFLFGFILGIALLLFYQNVVKPIIDAGKAKPALTSRLETKGGVIAKQETPAVDTTIKDTTQVPDIAAEAKEEKTAEVKTTTAPIASFEYSTTGDSYYDRLVNNFKREPSYIDNVEGLYDHYMQSGQYSAAARVCRDALATGSYVGDYRARIESWLSEAENRY